MTFDTQEHHIIVQLTPKAKHNILVRSMFPSLLSVSKLFMLKSLPVLYRMGGDNREGPLACLPRVPVSVAG